MTRMCISPADPEDARGPWSLWHVVSLAGLSAAAWSTACWCMTIAWGVMTLFLAMQP